MNAFDAAAKAQEDIQQREGASSSRAGSLNRAAEAITLLGLCGLMFVWPIGHTVALRNVLIGVNLVLSVWLVWRSAGHAWPRELSWVVIPLLLLTVWAFLGAALFSQSKALAFKEIRGQWLMSLVVFALGALAGSAAQRGTILSPVTLLGGLWAITMAHVIVVDFQGAQGWWRTGQMPHRLPGLTPGAPSMSYLVTPFACLLVADVFCRVAHQNRLFPVSNLGLSAGIVASLVAMYFIGVRHGTISFLMIVAALAVLYCIVSRGKRRWGMIAFGLTTVMLVAGGVGYVSYRKDSRWEKFIGTLPLAWDTETHKAWLDKGTHPLPRLADGREVDDSTYERVAFIKEGLVLVRDSPLGVGFGRDAFGQALRRKYGVDTGDSAHAHSGLLDLAIGTGIPGLILWLVFLGTGAWVGWREYRRSRCALGLGLFVFVAVSALRMAVDSTQRDHMLQSLMFSLGLLIVLVASESRASGQTT